MQDHVQPVGEPELLIGHLKWRGRLRTQRNGQQGEQDEQNMTTHAASAATGSIVLHFFGLSPRSHGCDEPRANQHIRDQPDA